MRTKILLIVISCAVSFFLMTSRTHYPPSIDHFYADEFKIFSKQYTVASIMSAFLHPWIPQNEKDSIRYFYRPLSIVAYAGLYEAAGQDVSKIHLIKQIVSFFKIAALFAVLYLLIRSLSAAFTGTLAYTLSFKVFDEQVVFQCFPDLLIAIYFFSGLAAFVIFTRTEEGSTPNIISGAIVALSYLLAIGTKESGVFLIPTLAAYWYIFQTSGGNPFKTIKEEKNRKYLLLLAILTYFTSWYFWMRLEALGPTYVFSTSSPYSTAIHPLIVIALNIQNSFALVPWSFVQSTSDPMMATKILVNLLLPLAALSFCRDRRLVIFALILVAVNTFFYSQAVRARFNSIGNIGTFLMVGVIIQSLISKGRRHPRIALVGAPALILAFYFYAAFNVQNILNRQSPNVVNGTTNPPPRT